MGWKKYSQYIYLIEELYQGSLLYQDPAHPPTGQHQLQDPQGPTTRDPGTPLSPLASQH